MFSKDILRQVAAAQKKGLLLKKDIIERDILSDVLEMFGDERVLVITGVRRCGKSTLLKQIIEKQPSFCYFNFEDERLLDFKAQDFEVLNETLLEIYGPTKVYFFDEIQNIPMFEAFVRRLQDDGKKVVLTGSNASLLSREYGTKLTGRYKSFEVYPFSFGEFLRYTNRAIDREDIYSTEKRVEIYRSFRKYLAKGGFPEYLKNKDPDYLRTLYENILYKDIISRYSIRKEKNIKELVNLLTTNATRSFTYNSLKNTLGLANAITVKEYISYLSNSYLFFELYRFSYSLKKQLALPRKIFLIDNGLNQIIGSNFSDNTGRNLENMVFIELKRQGKEVFYYRDKRECDFLVKEGTKITLAIQVCHVLDKDNREREIDGLFEAMEKFKLKHGLILTSEQREEIKRHGKKIKILPVYDWLIG